MNAPSKRLIYPHLEAYGEGGFRLDGERHDGSVLIVNGEVSSWPVETMADISLTVMTPVFQASPRPELILLGCGAMMTHPPAALSDWCRREAVGLEFMDTGAACRVYATLVGQGRHIAAALIAV